MQLTPPSWLDPSSPLDESVPALRATLLSQPLVIDAQTKHNSALLSSVMHGGSVYIPLRKNSKSATGRYSGKTTTVPGSVPASAYDENGELSSDFNPYSPRHAGYYKNVPLTEGYGVRLRSANCMVLDFDDTSGNSTSGICNDDFLTYVAASLLSLGIDIAKHPVTVTPHGLHVYLKFSFDYYVTGAKKSWSRMLDYAQGYTEAPTEEESRNYRVGVAKSKLSKFSQSFSIAAENALLDNPYLSRSVAKLFTSENGALCASSFEKRLMRVLDIDFRLPSDARFVIGPGSTVGESQYVMYAPRRPEILGGEQAHAFTAAFRSSNTQRDYMKHCGVPSSPVDSVDDTVDGKASESDSKGLETALRLTVDSPGSNRSQGRAEALDSTSGDSLASKSSQAPVIASSKMKTLRDRVRSYRYQVGNNGEPKRVDDSYHSIRASVYCALQCCYDEEAIADVCVFIGADRDTSSNRSIPRGEVVADLVRFKSKSSIFNHARGHGWLCPRCSARRAATVTQDSTPTFSPFRMWVKNTRERFVLDIGEVVSRLSMFSKPTTQVFTDALYISEAWIQTLSNLGMTAIRLGRSHISEVSQLTPSRIDKAMRLLRRSRVIEILKRPSSSGRTTVYRVCDGLRHRKLTTALQLLSSAAVVKVSGTSRFVNPAVVVRRRGSDVELVRVYDSTSFDPSVLVAHRNGGEVTVVEMAGCSTVPTHENAESTAHLVCSRVAVAEKEVFRSGMAQLSSNPSSPVGQDVVVAALHRDSVDSYQKVSTTKHVRGARLSRYTVKRRKLGLDNIEVSEALLDAMLRKDRRSENAAGLMSLMQREVESLEKEGYWWLSPRDAVPRHLTVHSFCG